MTGVEGVYRGMELHVSELDRENLEFYRHCSEHRLHLQQCVECDLLRFPPTTACPWCSCLESRWAPVEGRGVVHSYAEVTHAIQPAFRDHLPYLILLVELDEQRGNPTEHEAIRFTGNLVTPDGELAAAEEVAKVGIGSRLRLVFVDVGERLSLPQWTLDEEAEQPERPWRYG